MFSTRTPLSLSLSANRYEVVRIRTAFHASVWFRFFFIYIYRYLPIVFAADLFFYLHRFLYILSLIFLYHSVSRIVCISISVKKAFVSEPCLRADPSNSLSSFSFHVIHHTSRRNPFLLQRKTAASIFLLVHSVSLFVSYRDCLATIRANEPSRLTTGENQPPTGSPFSPKRDVSEANREIGSRETI